MARGINKVILVGNLGADPEVRYAANGNAIATLSIATSENWKDKATGEPREKTEWHRVVIFGRLAEVAGQYLKKGSQVYIEGKLQTRKWQDQNGQDRYTTEVVVDVTGTMQLLGGTGDRNMGMAAGMGGAAPDMGGPGQQPSGYGNAQSGDAGHRPPPGTYQGANSSPGQAPAGQPAPIGEPLSDFDDDIPF